MNVCLSLIHLSTCLPVCLSSIYPLACLSVSQPSIHQNIYVSPFSSFPFSLSTYIYPTYLSINRPFDRMLTIHVHIYQRHLSPLSPSLASPAVRACAGLGTPATLPSRVIYPHSRHGRVQPVSTCHTHGTNTCGPVVYLSITHMSMAVIHNTYPPTTCLKIALDKHSVAQFSLPVKYKKKYVSHDVKRNTKY